MARRPLLQHSLRLYDRVIVPHDEAQEVPVPEGVAAVSVGPILIRDRDEVMPREAARRKLGLAEGRTVRLHGDFFPTSQPPTHERPARAPVQSSPDRRMPSPLRN